MKHALLFRAQVRFGCSQRARRAHSSRPSYGGIPNWPSAEQNAYLERKIWVYRRVPEHCCDAWRGECHLLSAEREQGTENKYLFPHPYTHTHKRKIWWNIYIYRTVHFTSFCPISTYDVLKSVTLLKANPQTIVLQLFKRPSYTRSTPIIRGRPLQEGEAVITWCFLTHTMHGKRVGTAFNGAMRILSRYGRWRKPGTFVSNWRWAFKQTGPHEIWESREEAKKTKGKR